eukprot:9468686-Pyramimonas_sp.AAC.2
MATASPRVVERPYLAAFGLSRHRAWVVGRPEASWMLVWISREASQERTSNLEAPWASSRDLEGLSWSP